MASIVYTSTRVSGPLWRSMFDWALTYRAVYKQPSDAPHSFDYIVCAHKAINISSVPASFKTVTSDETTFVLMQNGVGNEDPFREAYPKCTIISGVVWVGAIQTSPGVIKHTKSEETEMGLFPNPALSADLEQARLDAFARFLGVGQTRYTIWSNIQVQRWKKVVWNAAWNPITTLAMVDTQTWLQRSEAMTMTKKLMHEVIEVAQKCGVPLEHNLVDEQIERILAMPGIGSSMQTDAKAGRKLELEVILGVPLKRARERGMDVPTLAAVYALTEAVDGRLGSA